MIFPPSKPADKYNYLVATYLQVIGLPELGPHFNTQDADIDPTPQKIPQKSTLFGSEISFDIIISKSNWEMLIECKHTEQMKPVSLISSAFKEAMAEFLSSLPLRDYVSYKSYKYIFITNGNTDDLKNSLHKLSTSSDVEIQKFLEGIKNTAKNKWSNVDVTKVTTEHVRICLNDLKIFTITDGVLENLLQENSEFSNKFLELYSKIGKPLPDLPSGIPSSAKFVLAYEGDEYVSGRWKNYPVFISSAFIDYVLSHKSVTQKMIEIQFDEIPSYVKIHFSYDDNLLDYLTPLFSLCINDHLQSIGSKIAVVITPAKKRLFIFDPSWLHLRSSDLKETNYTFLLSKIADSLSLPLGGELLKIAIQEAYRIVTGINVDSNYFISD